MKRKLTFISLLLMGFCLVSCGPSKQDAINYSYSITKQQIKIVDAENRLTGAVKQGNDKDLDRIFNELSAQVDSSAAIVKKMEAFDGKTELKDATTAFISIYRSVVDHEYTAWLVNLKTPADKVNDKVLDEEKVLIQNINDKLNKATEDFKRAQHAFADKYKFVM